MLFQIHKLSNSDRDWVNEIFRGWGADFIVSRGRKIYPDMVEGFYAEDDNSKRVGLVTYEIVGYQCEVVTLDAFEKFGGIGTALLNKVIEIAKEKDSPRLHRLWLITLNDNLDAIRFYQKRGMTIAAIHINALEESRRIKPTIPKIGQYGIPLRDEIEFEILL